MNLTNIKFMSKGNGSVGALSGLIIGAITGGVFGGITYISSSKALANVINNKLVWNNI